MTRYKIFQRKFSESGGTKKWTEVAEVNSVIARDPKSALNYYFEQNEIDLLASDKGDQYMVVAVTNQNLLGAF